MKYNSRLKISVFWEYVLMCILVITISGVLVGGIAGKAYIRAINDHQLKLVQSQADHAVSDLNSQLDSMHKLSLKMSIQYLYQQSYFRGNAVNEIEVATSLSQYSSYADLASEFALMYRHPDGTIKVFRSIGTTTEIDVFLNLYDIEISDELTAFIFDQTESGRLWQISNGVLIAFPVSMNSRKFAQEGGTLCFILDSDAIQKRIALSGDLEAGSYSLSYMQYDLISIPAGEVSVGAGSSNGFYLQANVCKEHFSSLLTCPNDIALIFLCITLLLAFILFLSWQCYRPIRSLAEKYTSSKTVSTGNELVRLEHAIESMRSHSDLLDEENASQANLLQNYVLLMLLNDTRTQNISEELKKVGIEFSFKQFFVVTIAAASDQVVTSKNIELLSQSLTDIAEDNGLLFSVECSTTSHILAILCNVEDEEQHQTIINRMCVFLNRQPIKFFIGVGSLTNSFAGISASYLSALSQLRFSINSHNRTETESVINKSESSKLIAQIIFQIERGSCQEALMNLDAYMEEIESHQSELSRRYTVMDITYAIRQLCTKLDYQLTEEQLSILLSMGNVQSIHFALLHLIPSLCACAKEKNTQGILSSDAIVADYLKRHYKDYDISVQKIANAIGIGINRTSAIIRDHFGNNLKTVITSMRVEEAKNLLRNTNMSVADISTTLGYSGASYFIKVFKAVENITPDAYRKMVKPN